MSLTGRGKTLLAVSAAVGLIALVVGEGDLLRAAMLAAVAPIGGLVMLRWTRPDLESNRVLNPGQVEAGQPTQVRLGIRNTGRRRPPALMLEDRIPYRLGNRPRLVLERLAPGSRSVVNYTITPGSRGAYKLGPLLVRCSDPFGLAVTHQEFPVTTQLVVTPRTERLPSLKLPGGAGLTSGESQAQAVAITGDDDIAVREYRNGDDLRRVHWKASAHRGELMVRREEQPWENAAAVLLDLRRGAHRGEGDLSSLEWMVGAAASATVRLARDGMSPRLVTSHAEFECHRSDYSATLRYLATVTAARDAPLSHMMEQTKRHRSAAGVVAFLGHLTPEEAAVLGPLTKRGGHCVAMVLDPTRWGPPHREGDPREQAFAEQHRRAAAALMSAGWQVFPVVSGLELRHVWTRLALWKAAMA
ncbi:DUF58 domain-containing protein [Glycomyces xiaoerkulensis]|uniref:DUF58 domain-containing protein n=1 Tax=Glycomyces xiaoerkulensis TaxID=2038139 RepID=UPI000C257E83|nr:DUF58 domain-containing protein [Glycomyces xiaoerkulensis]